MFDLGNVAGFVQAQPGLLLNHGNDYLNYQDDWYVLDHGNEDDPELGFVLIYYRGQTLGCQHHLWDVERGRLRSLSCIPNSRCLGLCPFTCSSSKE